MSREDATVHLKRIADALDAFLERQRIADLIAVAKESKMPLAPPGPRDEVLRFTPAQFKKYNYKGMKMSECPPRVLDEYARALNFFAEKEKAENKVIPKGKAAGKLQYLYTLATCGHARRWALDKRIKGEPEFTPPPERPVNRAMEEAFNGKSDGAADNPFDQPHDDASFEFGANAPQAESYDHGFSDDDEPL